MGLVSSTPPHKANAATRTPAAAAVPAAGKPARAKNKASTPAKKRKARNPLTLLGLAEAQHALLVAPAEYVDCRHPITRIEQHLVGDESPRTFKLQFSGEAFGRDGKKQPLWKTPSLDVPEFASLARAQIYATRASCLTLVDEAGTALTCRVFGLPTAWLDLRQGDTVWITGTVVRFGSKLSMQLQHRLPAHAINSVWPRYSGRAGVITAERVEACVHDALRMDDAPQACAAHICNETGRDEPELVEELLAGAGFQSLAGLLAALHAPASPEQGLSAIAIARQLSALAMATAAARRHARAASPQAPITIAPDALAQLVASLEQQGRVLTEDQRAVADRIVERLQQQQPLSALLSGDVGTGKTLAFLLPAVAAHLGGAQVAIVAPLRLLADQIALELLERFGPLVRGVQRVENQIDDPAAILVGTQGLLNAAQRQGYLPNLLIFDEQHRLSTQQREACVASRTHTLEVSATPIPRTLAASIYASIEQLQLRQSPVKKSIASHIVGMADKQRVISAIRAALSRGERCAIIYPRVNPAEGGSPHECVTGAFASFLQAFPDHAVMIHGELSQGEIDANLAMFRSGQRRLAVASTILEVGIDVPSISVMVVRDAENFGMSQLHQLRGRLARQGGSGEFLMVVDDPAAVPPDTLKRLEGVVETTDGYSIAEKDLLLRGFGDLDGVMQSGASDTLFKQVRLSAVDFVGKQIAQRRKALAGAETARPTSAAPKPAPAASWRAPSFVRREPRPAEPAGGPQPGTAGPSQPNLF